MKKILCSLQLSKLSRSVSESKPFLIVTVTVSSLLALIIPKPVSAASPISQLKDNPIVKDINQIVNFLSAGVGIIVIAALIVGGIQYMAAGDNPQGLTNAKKRIANAMIALLAFIFMFAFLQWLIPGGVFN